MSNTLVTELYPIVEKTLSVKANEDKMFKVIGGFIDRNMEKLSKPGPVDRVAFETRDKAAAASIILFVIILAVTLVQMVLSKKLVHYK